MRRSVAPSPNILLNLLRAYSARARGSFLLEKKGTKDSPKRRYPLWILLLRARPHLCFLRCLTFLCAVPRMDKVHSPNLGVIKILPRELRKRSSLPLSAPLVGECQVLHLPLRAAECSRRAHLPPTYGGSKGVTLDPLRWRSRNQEVPCVLFVKLSSHKKVSAGAGCVSPHGSCRNQPANTISALELWAKENRGVSSPV